MATGLLTTLETPETVPEPMPESSVVGDQPAYLTRIATLPATLPERDDTGDRLPSTRPQSARLDQIEHALSILASVVARLAKEAQQSRLQRNSTEHDPNIHEERRVQRELVRSMQARLTHLEERLERRNLPPVETSPAVNEEEAQQVAESLASIRKSLAALTKRRTVTRSGCD